MENPRADGTHDDSPPANDARTDSPRADQDPRRAEAALQGRSRAGAPAHRRHTVDASAGVTLALGLPWFLCSLAVVATVASGLGPVAAGAVVVGWLASGLATIHGPVADLLAATLLRLSRPTPAEHAQLQPAWEAVTAAAGIDGSRFVLGIQHSDQVNAFAAGDRVVAITSWSLRTLRPDQLAAVLAHELGHHLGGHVWSALLSYWYSLPARVVLRCAQAVTRLLLVLLAYTSLLGYVVVAAVLVVAPLVVLRTYPLLLLLVLVPPLLASAGRRGELRCDRLAAELGYGPALIEVLQHWITAHEPRRSSILAMHPTARARVRALERYLVS